MSFYCISGPQGSGKSTLLNKLNENDNIIKTNGNIARNSCLIGPRNAQTLFRTSQKESWINCMVSQKISMTFCKSQWIFWRTHTITDCNHPIFNPLWSLLHQHKKQYNKLTNMSNYYIIIGIMLEYGIYIFISLVILFAYFWNENKWRFVQPTNNADWIPNHRKVARALVHRDGSISLQNVRDTFYDSKTLYTPKYFDIVVHTQNIVGAKLHMSSKWYFVVHIFITFRPIVPLTGCTLISLNIKLYSYMYRHMIGSIQCIIIINSTAI